MELFPLEGQASLGDVLQSCRLPNPLGQVRFQTATSFLIKPTRSSDTGPLPAK